MEGNVTLLNGDCLVKMADMPDNFVDSVITDPPYGLSSGSTKFLGEEGAKGGLMGKEWDHGVPGVEFWGEALRVSKPGAHMLAFGGTRTYHRLMVAIEDAGWEIRDCIMWVYSQGFPKGLNIGKAAESLGNENSLSGWNTALKPAWEPIIVARKRCEGTVVENALKYGTGGLNIGACKIGEELVVSTKGMGKNRLLNDDNWKGIGKQLAPEVNTGRFPANIVHDGSEEVSRLFPRNDSGSFARFFYCAKASTSDRDEGVTGENTHPTVKPLELMSWLCKLVTPKNGTVLDPFMGSGSTGKAAIIEGFRFVGIEKEQEYFDIARERIGRAQEKALKEGLNKVEDTTDLFEE